jgi:hypothetical protein
MANDSKSFLHLEQRQRRRWKTLKTAKILADDGHRVVECIVRDLSDEGARLELPRPEVPCDLNLPETFTLAISGGASRDCEVVWSSNTERGVRFLVTTRHTETMSDRAALMQRLHSIQDHLDKVQKQLNELRGDLEADIGG